MERLKLIIATPILNAAFPLHTPPPPKQGNRTHEVKEHTPLLMSSLSCFQNLEDKNSSHVSAGNWNIG